MPERTKITVEIPAYLKDWIDAHDVGQNALVTIALRSMYLSEKQANESIIVRKILEALDKNKLPF